ncbi:polysaccharide deacetylase family protein [Arthrobacter sp. UCD-GKA]|uniref:polysaccharide deacetylase family protein n=1 Tax=Arthrobacter sp. UCD-GKA TaxID=1913576 RepID=UPI001587417A|nr:polysaccharide deacetylase family protein [Arthrobacter sp. UCD-GKA]
MGITYPENPDLHPSEVWWKNLATTTNAAILNAKGDATSGDALQQVLIDGLAVEVAASYKYRGELPDATDFNTLAGRAWEGIWSVVGTARVNTMINSPVTGVPGYVLRIEVAPGSSGSVTIHTVIPYGSSFGFHTRSTNNLAGTNWVAWKKLAFTSDITDWNKGIVPNNSDFFTLDPGWYQVEKHADAETMTNAPVPLAGHLEVLRSPSGVKALRYTTYGGTQAVYLATTGSVTNGTMQPWWNITGGLSEPEQVGPYQREALIKAFRDRRAYCIGTGWLPAYGLRFDHGLKNFIELLLPILIKYGMPWSQVVNSRNIDRAENGGYTWANLQQKAIDHGGEMGNHGAAHADALTRSSLFDQIVTGKAELEGHMQRLPVEWWAPPGLSDGYMGAAPFNTLEQHYGTYAGRLIMANHAGISGYVPGAYRPLPQNLPIATTHITMDKAATSTMNSIFNTVAGYSEPTAVQLMLHPNLVGEIDPKDGKPYMTLAEFEVVIASLAERRDAGELVMLTSTGLLVADHREERGNNLLRNPTFTGSASEWFATGWARADDGGGTGRMETTGSTQLSQTFNLYRREYFKGGTRDLNLEVKATAGATVTLSVVHGTELNTTKTVTVPPGSNWVPVHMPFTIPLDLPDTNVTVGIQGNGSPLQVRKCYLSTI